MNLAREKTLTVTKEVINYTLCKLVPYPNGDVFTVKGFEVLANWSEQQEWWNKFAGLNGLGQDWRALYSEGDRYVFVYLLFRFVMDASTCESAM